jgi:hypothetical protein
MRSLMPSRIVIDACIAAYASDKAGVTAQQSHDCRAFLELFVNGTELHVAMSPEILREWKDHASVFSKQWRVNMWQQGRVDEFQTISNAKLRDAIAANAPDKHRLDAMNKDLHLLELALQAERSIVSADEKARKPFHAIVSAVPMVGSVMWVNPTKPRETPFVWLRKGAPEERRRFLGQD